MKHRRFDNIGEDLYSGTLKNGLRVNVVTKPGFQTAYAVLAANYGGAHRSFYLGGERHETPAGVAHYLEHKMFDMPDGGNALSLLSANGASPNAFTSSGMTAYHFECTDKFEENLRLLLRFVSTPYFTDETVAKEQGIIAQEIRMVEDSPGYVIYNRLMRMLHERHPIRDTVAGSIESISHITAETLHACHSAFYAPSNMALCVAANCDPERVFAIADELLPRERTETPIADMGPKEGNMPLKSYNEELMEVSESQFLIGAKVKPAASGEALLRQRIAGQLALRALFGSSSDFYLRLYSEGLLGGDFDWDLDYSAGTATIMLSGESRAPQRILDAVRQELEGSLGSGIDEKALGIARRASYGSRLRALESFDSLCLSLVDGAFGGYCALDCFNVLESVTAEECLEFINGFMTPDKLAMSVISPVKV